MSNKSIITIVVILIIGVFFGWYIYSNQTKPTPTENPASQGGISSSIATSSVSVVTTPEPTPVITEKLPNAGFPPRENGTL